MLDLQDSMNSKVNPDWRNAGYEWYRAIWVECAELMDHYGWKWWKKQTPDIEQVKLELVDIWHFGLSHLLTRKLAEREVLVDYIEDAWVVGGETTLPFKKAIEKFASETLSGENFKVDLFSQLCQLSDMGFNELYVGYVGKNVLNFFRQDNGYKTGEYRKNWYDGREDNEHLVEIVASLDTSLPDFKDQLYTKLTERYNLTT